MFRRLYFLLPNAALTQSVIDELYKLDIKAGHVHAMSHEGMAMPFLPEATRKQKQDKIHYIEDILWVTNLVLFFVAFAAFIYSAIAGELFFSIVSLSVMALTFIAGDFFVLYIPHTHLNEFKHAINHNEILLMVDVPKSRMAEIEDRVHKHHPAAIEGGSSWSFQFMGL